MKSLTVLLALTCAACTPDSPAPDVAGISPDRAAPTQPAPRAEVELSAPAAQAPTPATTEAVVVAPSAKIVFEIAPYGRFEVVTWAEAARRAEAQITRENGQAELRRLRQDLLGRRR